MAHLVESLHYKLEVCGFDSRWCHWNFSLTQSFRPRYGPGVDSASNRNEYQEYFLEGKGSRCMGLTILPCSCANCLESGSVNLLEPSGFVQACTGIYFSFLFLLYIYTYCLGSCSLNCHILETYNFNISTCSWHTPLEHVW